MFFRPGDLRDARTIVFYNGCGALSEPAAYGDMFFAPAGLAGPDDDMFFWPAGRPADGDMFFFARPAGPDGDMFFWRQMENHVAERPVYVTLLRVGTVARTEFEDEEFRLWYDMGGSMVSDHTHEKAPEGDAFVYTVPASDEELARLAGNRGNTRWWLVVANVGVAVVLIVGIALKRRRQKQ